jgi:outer membrane protein assembly factor BamB
MVLEKQLHEERNPQTNKRTEKEKKVMLDSKPMKITTHRCLLALSVALFIGSLFGAKIKMAESRIAAPPKERWSFTSKSNFSLYALLALAPIYRDQIEAAIVAPEHVYLTFGVSSGGAEILALGRHRGQIIWQRRLASEGWPIRGAFIKVGDRLVLALYDGKTKELIVLALDPSSGTLIWQAKLPANHQPAIYEEVLDADHRGELVNVYFHRTKQRNRVVLRARNGEQLAEKSYNGYIWPYGTRRARGLVFGYDGIPHERKHYRLIAFDETGGQLAWTFPLQGRWTSPPVVVDDSLFITSENKLVKIDLKTGKSHWTADLEGYRPVNPDPPVVIGSRIAVAHTATLDPEDSQWKVSLRRVTNGKEEAQVALHRGQSETFTALRPMADLVIVGSYFVLQVVDSQSAEILATLDFERAFSWFVYSDPPSMRVADNDAQGFVVVTSDGKLRYFAAEDFRSISSSQVSPTEKETSGFNISMIFFYLVVNPLWDMVLPNRFTFLVLFYSLPLLMIGLVWMWKPLRELLRRKGIARGARWGGWIGLVLSLPAAIYRGLIGGIAAGFGLYGSFGPIWGGFVGFSTFMIVGLLLGVIIGSLCSLVWRQVRWRTSPDD